jgi:hypothetical protein
MSEINGFPVGRKLDSNGVPEATARVVPPALQPLHICLSGSSGSGKSTHFETALLHNQRATAGCDIVFDSKGDGLPEEFQRINYAADGTLTDVVSFDLEEMVPAIGFFDIRSLLHDEWTRQQAIDRITDHYLEIARAAYAGGFDDSKRAPRLIRDLIRALFDPVHGSDAFRHRQLRAAARQFKIDATMPTVSDPDLERRLAERATIAEDTREAIADAVTDRLDSVTDSPQLRTLLNHVPPAPSEPAARGDTPVAASETVGEAATVDAATAPDGRRFSFRQLLSQDVVVLFDTSGLGRYIEPITLALLSSFWRACQRRKAGEGDESFPIANLYLEEAGTFAASGLFTELLPLARGFDVGIVLIVQYPSQLIPDDRGSTDSIGVLNNIGTMISGRVAGDELLETYFEGPTLDRSDVRERLDNLARGTWLVETPERFGDERKQPFESISAPLPPGHPEGDAPLSEIGLEAAFNEALEARRETTAVTLGLPLDTPTDTGATPPATDRPDTATAESLAIQRGSLLPRTERLPACVSYATDRHSLDCADCDTAYPPTQTGLDRAIGCCHDPEAVDRADRPVIDCHIDLSGAEIAASELSAGQLCFMQLIHEATHQRLDPRAFRLTDDSMLRLREYAGIDAEAVAALTDAAASATFGLDTVDDGEPLVTVDTDVTPHRVYSLTDAGRSALGISLTAGRDYGDYVGDLGESALHRLMVIAGCQLLEQRFVADPDSPAVAVNAYQPVGGNRLDAAAVADNGAVVAALEAESNNHDHKTAVPADYDTMAECQPDAAVWVVPNRAGGHSVLDALNDPATGSPRVEKTYSDSTPPHQFRIDTPGCTEIISISRLLSQRESPVSLARHYLRGDQSP